MSGQQNWRTEVTGLDYFQHQKKQADLEHRRPVIRKASDLVGPGIGANATRITDFNDALATFDGYFGAAAGAANAPTSGQAYVGVVTSDGDLGGMQVFYGMTDGGTYKRLFTRSPADNTAISWGLWVAAQANTDDAAWNVIGATGAPAFQNGWGNYGSTWETAGYIRKGGVVYLRGLIGGGTVTSGTVIFNLPVGYRPTSDKHFATTAAASAAAFALLNVMANGDVKTNDPFSNTWASLANISFPID